MTSISWIRTVIDIVVLVVLLILAQVVFKVIPPHKTGFNCDDFSVNMPFNSSTVTNAILAVIALIVTLVFIVGTEITRLIVSKFVKKGKTTQKEINYYINLCCFGKRKLPETISNLYALIGKIFLFENFAK